MGIKLRILSWWTPEWFLKKGLDELALSTIGGLEEVLFEDKQEFDKAKTLTNFHLKGNLDERRRMMAKRHDKLVKILIDNLGHDKAMDLGRKIMFKEGLDLGRKFRDTLGVEDSLEDLIAAARILYKVLGIEFTVREISNANNNTERVMVVNRCLLSEYYTSDTCRILSAADEGVVQGLNPQIKMKFTERITEGTQCCLASLCLEDGE
jgi:hypothetical protein